MVDGSGIDGAEVRRRQILAIPVDSGPSGLRRLVAALADPSWRVRKEAVSKLASWPQAAAAAESLVGPLVETDDVATRNAAIEALVRIGTPALVPLTDALARRPPHRKFLVDALGAIGDVGAVRLLIGMLGDDDLNVRVAAAEALSRCGGREAARALLGLLDARDMMLQLTVLDALAELGVVVPAGKLTGLMDRPVVRCSALRLLGRCRDLAAVAPLTAALSDKTRRAREAATESLRQLIEDLGGSARDLVAVAVAELPREAVDRLAMSVAARDPDVRRGAALLIGLGGHRSALPQLVAGLLDPVTGTACSEAIEVLGPEAIAAAELEPMPPPPAGNAEMSADEFNALRDLIHAHCGIYFQADAAYLLRRRLAPRLEAIGVASFEEYCGVLKRARETGEREGGTELDRVVEQVSTNETYFFREAYQLRAFRDEILPGLRRHRPRGRNLTVWSAGCSTGEEAYTIAMLVHSCGAFADWRVEIVGMDISQRVLEVAERGLYSRSSVRNDELPELRRYLLPTGDGYRVDDEVRELVSFRQVNLVSARQVAELGEVDVVFCRNVLMYFDRATRSRAVASLYEKIIPGGYLLLGHSESLINLSTAFELVQLHNDAVYQKPEM